MPDTEKEALCARIDELCAENEQLRQENQSIGMAAYEVGYKDGSTHYELEYCPACKNVADLQEALDENAKLRELVRFIMHQCNDGNPRCDECIDWNGGECVALTRMRELGIEVTE